MICFEIFQISGSKLAAGYDLKSAYDYIVPGMGKIIAKTDISIRVPDGTYGRVAPRSGLAAKNHIDIGAGVVDQDYTGNIGVVMFNHTQEDFGVKKGDLNAQFIAVKQLEDGRTLSVYNIQKDFDGILTKSEFLSLSGDGQMTGSGTY